MLYRFLKFLMKQSLAAHYLEIKGIGLNTIPKTGPIMIAASHPNSFLDAILIAALINRPLHFLARSDVFRAKWANYILRRLNLIPIYRMQEGHQNLSRNDQTFRECHTILENDGAILIFVEGISLTDMKLRPLKKGLARIAFGFAEKHNFEKECQIVPLALNYDRPMDFRSKIIVGIGKVQKISDFKTIYKQNNNNAFIALNEQLFKELQEHTVEVNEENYMVYKAIAELDSCFNQNSLSRKILIAEHIKEVAAKNSSSLKELQLIIQDTFALLKKYKLNFRKLKSNVGINVKKTSFIVLSAPLALLCFLLNLLPIFIAKLITDKTVKLDEFYASVRLVLDSILWLLWMGTLTVIGLSYSWLFILTPLVLFFSIKFYLHYYEEAKYVLASLRIRKLKKNKEEFDFLQHHITQIYRIRTNLGLSPKAN